jgi:hypothetical protein
MALHQVKAVCVLKVAEEEFPSVPQAPMPIVVLWLLDFITLWV